jgi:cytochrome c553
MRRARAGLAALVGAVAACVALAQTPAPGDPERTQMLAVTRGCTGCHGADGNSIAPAFPKLAGLQASYIAKQLADFKQGKRASAAMAQQVASLSEQDMSDLATFFARNKMTPGTASDPAVTKVGKLVYDDGNPATGVPGCSGCHSPDGLGSSRFPRLAGQSAEYLFAELKTFASGKRRNDRGMMQTVTERMTEREMKTVSAFLSGLPGPSQ